MALPKLKVPVSRLKSMDGKVTYTIRPFSNKEQNILLMAKESVKASTDKRQAMKAVVESMEQVIGNCLIDANIDDIPWYDFQFLMIEIRKISVDNISKLSFKCTSTKEDGSKCNTPYTIGVNLDKIEVVGKVPETKDDRVIDIDGNVSAYMRHPTFKMFKSIYLDDLNEYNALRMFIEYVFDKEGNIYPMAEATDQELEEFLEDAGPNMKKIQDWIESAPKPYYRLEYTCRGCGNKKVIELRTPDDFF